MARETILCYFCALTFCFLVRGRGACDAYNSTCDESAFLQHDSSFRGRHGTWALPRDWQTSRDIANISAFEPITWGKIEDTDVVLNFFTAVPVFGQDGNYIALLHNFNKGGGSQLRYLQTGELSLFCSGPGGSHRTKVRGLGNETNAAYKIYFVFLCDWPEEDKHLERFEVSLEDGQGKQLGVVVAEQKNGLLQQYHTAACLRDVWPGVSGLRQLPQWIEFQLLHGIDHILFYTVNIDSEILVDLYEPYIKSGVVTRVHLHQEREGAGSIQDIVVGDCLYRFKNHANWLLPSVDIDEYIHVKDGNLFGGGEVPDDYLGSSWDAIVKKQGLQPNTVRSISFGRYRFQLAQPGQVELSSVLREPQPAELCPKYVVNPILCDCLHVHWCTSWKTGTENLGLGADTLIAHEFRNPPHSYAIEKHIEANATDTSMQQYIPGLSRSLAARFQEETTHLLSRLSSVERIPLKTSTLIHPERLESDTDKELQVADPTTAAWIRSFSKVKGIVNTDPPAEHALHSAI
mmetsp:Transcript_57927/g.94160  ORF Transcript_57927/g.94160 Transcript_57927/m.94160 type:complete len:518 (+) Transcript_57927:47-1600(+)